MIELSEELRKKAQSYAWETEKDIVKSFDVYTGYKAGASEMFELAGKKISEILQRKGFQNEFILEVLVDFDKAFTDTPIIQAKFNINEEVYYPLGRDTCTVIDIKYESNAYWYWLDKYSYWTSENSLKKIEPKFKLGNYVKTCDGKYTCIHSISEYAPFKYHCYDNKWYDENELTDDGFSVKQEEPCDEVYYKFNPFDKVLVRCHNNDNWVCAFFSHMNNGKYQCTNGYNYSECIPYEGNEKLLGTNKKQI